MLFFATSISAVPVQESLIHGTVETWIPIEEPIFYTCGAMVRDVYPIGLFNTRSSEVKTWVLQHYFDVGALGHGYL